MKKYADNNLAADIILNKMINSSVLEQSGSKLMQTTSKNKCSTVVKSLPWD